MASLLPNKIVERFIATPEALMAIEVPIGLLAEARKMAMQRAFRKAEMAGLNLDQADLEERDIALEEMREYSDLYDDLLPRSDPNMIVGGWIKFIWR